MQDSKLSELIRITEPSAVALARRVAARRPGCAQLPLKRCDEWTIVASEAASNIVRHAGEGALIVASHPGRVELWAIDDGPGISDVKWAQRDGTSTGGGAGLGLGAIKRLSDLFAVHTATGDGTVVYAGIGADPDFSAVVLARPGVDVSGDGYALRSTGSERSIFVFDGLGHGPLAARSTSIALEVFSQHPELDPESLFRAVGASLRGERGGVASMVTFDETTGTFLGLGNVGVRLLHPTGGGQQLVPGRGTLGPGLQTLRPVRIEMARGSVVVLATDGLRSRWITENLDGVLARPAGIIAGTLLQKAHRGTDDAAVVVARAT